MLPNQPGLLPAFREGRPDALECVYKAYVDTVERHVRFTFRATGLAAFGECAGIDDAVQEVFARAFAPSARQAFDGVRDYAPYLMTIARNCIVDGMRARRREILKAPEEVSEQIDEAAPSSRNGSDLKVISILHGYLEQLPVPIKRIYEQRFTLGHSQQETALALGISRRAVRTGESHLARGLRRALQASGIFVRSTRSASSRPPP